MRRGDLKQEYDIVIIGGGMVGATLACALATRAGSKYSYVRMMHSRRAWNDFGVLYTAKHAMSFGNNLVISFAVSRASASASHTSGSISARKLTTVHNELTPLSVRLDRLHFNRCNPRER